MIGRLPDTAPYIGKPGYDVLDIPDWTPEKNDQWVQDIIDRNGNVLVASDPAGNLWDVAKNRETVFARELRMLQEAGYGPFPPTKGSMLSPPGGGP